MKIFLSRWLFIVVFFAITSCGERASIDKGYLESEHYQQFKERQEQEYAKRISDYRSLENYLLAFVECPLGKWWDFPIQMDDSILEGDIVDCEALSDYKTPFTTYYAGYSLFRDVTIRWIIIQKESVYKDAELWAVTYRDSSLLNFKTVGIFGKNLKKNISTKVEVVPKDGYLFIQSSINQGVKYPLKYENVLQSVFRINSKGMIEEVADNDIEVF